MTSIGDKAAHVRRSKQSRPHTCHWTGCDRQVPPGCWGCKTHWFKLPAEIRGEIWDAYTVGQEDDHAKVSKAYLAAARRAEAWIAANYPQTRELPL